MSHIKFILTQLSADDYKACADFQSMNPPSVPHRAVLNIQMMFRRHTDYRVWLYIAVNAGLLKCDPLFTRNFGKQSAPKQCS
jgi:hypothetical protein